MEDNKIEELKPEKIEKPKKVLSQAQINHMEKMRQKKAIKNEAKKLIGQPTNYKKTLEKNNIENKESIETKKENDISIKPNIKNIDEIEDIKNKLNNVYEYIESKKNKPKDKDEKIDKIYKYIDEKQRKKEEKLKKQAEILKEQEEYNNINEEHKYYSNRRNYYSPLIGGIFGK